MENYDCIFADPPDNIGLEYDDDLTPEAYADFLEACLSQFIKSAPVVWVSFNAIYTFTMGRIVDNLIKRELCLEAKPCVQIFTFGQHRQTDMGNNHRPLWRLRRSYAPLYPDTIRVESERQRLGDSRADPRGRVPGDVINTADPSVFDYPRVVGNSPQRRSWHPTQLHENMVEQCIKLSTKEGDHVCDPFGGTGTTLRVCRRIGRDCTLIERESKYIIQLRRAHPQAE